MRYFDVLSKPVRVGLIMKYSIFIFHMAGKPTQILAPKCALMIVDVQNDFISGSMALKNGPAQQDGEKVVPVINRYFLFNSNYT